MLMPKATFKAPVEFLRNPYLDENMLAVVCLFVLGGYSMKAAFCIVYRPRCAPNSIPPQVCLFFQQKHIREMVEIFRSYYMEYPYTNPKAWAKK